MSKALMRGGWPMVSTVTFLAAWLGLAPGSPHVAGVGSARALDMDLRRPMFSHPQGDRAQSRTANRPAAADTRYRGAPTYQPPQQRGIFDSLFSAPQRPQYQPGYRPRPPATARPARPETRRVVRRPPPPAADIRPTVEKTEFVYLLAPVAHESLGEGLAAAFADRPIVGVRTLPPGPVTTVDASTLLAPLPASLADKGKSAVVVIPAVPDWGKLSEAQLQALVADVSTRVAARHASVVWVGLPPDAGPDASARSAIVNGMLRAGAAKTGGGFVDAWAGFSDDSGGFAAWGPGVTGEIVRLREDSDGALTRAGSRKLAHFIVTEVRRIQARQSEAQQLAPGPVDPFAMPGPQLPTKPSPSAAAPPSKPDVGPVTPLNPVRMEPGATLAPLEDSQRDLVDVVARRALQEGAPSIAGPGRADDFRWPRPGG